MHHYTATVRWNRRDSMFSDRLYSRAHRWSFDGGVEVPASASPLIVKSPLSDPQAVDPEEAFIASLSSCHMLFFLDYAARAGFVIDRYEDAAVGMMGKDAEGREFMQRVVLAPAIVWSGGKWPSAEEVSALHERAHHSCFIANSVKTEIVIDG